MYSNGFLNSSRPLLLNNGRAIFRFVKYILEELKNIYNHHTSEIFSQTYNSVLNPGIFFKGGGGGGTVKGMKISFNVRVFYIRETL